MLVERDLKWSINLNGQDFFSTVNNAFAKLAEDTTLDIVKFKGSLPHPLCATSGPRR